MKNRFRRSGFTLPEVLVTVTVVAVLAAVVVPAVVQQVGKGDVGQLTGDLKAAEGLVNTFATDIRAYPGYFKQLKTAIAVTDSAVDANGRRVYSTAEVGRWNGPYGGASGDSIVSGYGFVIGDTITVANSQLQITAHGPKIDATSKASYSASQIAHIDSLVDGATGATGGMIRWTLAGTTPDSAKNIKVIVGTVH